MNFYLGEFLPGEGMGEFLPEEGLGVYLPGERPAPGVYLPGEGLGVPWWTVSGWMRCMTDDCDVSLPSEGRGVTC